jgi:Transketolase, thiamine diphosphate binding domain
MLLWSVLHLSGTRAVNANYERLGQVSVSLDDIRRFRQMDSTAHGHPRISLGVWLETTTGPLGPGVATSVCMAIAGKWLADRYNRPGFTIFDDDIYAGSARRSEPARRHAVRAWSSVLQAKLRSCSSLRSPLQGTRLRRQAAAMSSTMRPSTRPE